MTLTTRTVLCANETCTRGEGGTRKVFYTAKENALTCCERCRDIRARRIRDANAPAEGLPRTAQRWSMIDLPAHEIERRLAALAAKRKAQRAWLRIDDPWAQRAGSALHQQALVTHSIDLEGALA